MLSKALLPLLALPAIVSAHFELVYPPARGSDDEGEATWPCAGFAQSENRTAVSTDGFNLQLNLGHDHSLITVLLALGNEANGAFSNFLYPTIQEEGPGDFCLPTITVPSNLNISDGTNGTIQVITDGHDGGGLYMCADITFSSSAPQPATSCTNGTGLTANFVSDPHALANGTSNSGGSSNSTSSGNNAASGLAVNWGMFGAAFLAAAASL